MLYCNTAIQTIALVCCLAMIGHKFCFWCGPPTQVKRPNHRYTTPRKNINQYPEWFWGELRWRSGLIGALATMESVQLNNGRVLSDDSYKQFVVAYCTFRACFNSLAERAISQKSVKYHMRPKQHYLGHLTWHFAKGINPRYCSNYLDEDFIARTKRVAEKSHPQHTSRLSLLRYTIHVGLRWSGGNVWKQNSAVKGMEQTKENIRNLVAQHVWNNW